MQANTVELLTAKGKFPTDQALVVAEVMDMAIHDAQIVTVPVFDASLSTFKTQMEAKFAGLEVRFAALEARVEARFVALENRVSALEVRIAGVETRLGVLEVKVGALDAKLDALEAKIDHKFERFRVQLIIAIVIGYAATGPLGAALVDALKHAF